MTVTDCTIGNHTINQDTAQTELDVSETPAVAGIVTTGVGQVRAIAGLCNAAEFDAATNNLPLEERRIHGDATDQAILRFSEGLGSVNHLRQSWQRTYELAFNSKNKYMIRTFSMFKDDLLSTTLPQAEAEVFTAEDTYVINDSGPPRITR